MSFAILPKVYKKSTAVVRLGVRRVRGEQHQNKELDKSEARRGGTLSQAKQLQLSNIFSIDVCYGIVMVLKLSINKEV